MAWPVLGLRSRVKSLRFRPSGSGFRAYCRPMINKPAPFKGLNIRIPIIVPKEGEGGLLIRGLH